MISSNMVLALANSYFSQITSGALGVEHYRIVGFRLATLRRLLSLDTHTQPLVIQKIRDFEEHVRICYYNSEHFHNSGEVLDISHD